MIISNKLRLLEGFRELSRFIDLEITEDSNYLNSIKFLVETEIVLIPKNEIVALQYSLIKEHIKDELTQDTLKLIDKFIILELTERVCSKLDNNVLLKNGGIRK